MNSKTKELIYLLFWAFDLAARPTFRNLTDSFEAWAYRNNFHRQLRALERQQLIERTIDKSGKRLHRLTKLGRSLALQGRDPAKWWKKRWDGKWRMVVFDVPQIRAADRARLRRSLADRGFGFLQNSVWISPHPLTEERNALGGSSPDVESLILLESRPCAGETDEEMVRAAWDFDAINAAYERHHNVLDRLPELRGPRDTTARKLQQWFQDERLAWDDAVRRDPLLPRCLHPTSYPGPASWNRKREVLVEACRRVRALEPFQRNS